MTDYAARSSEVDGSLTITGDGLAFAGQTWAWAVVDGVVVTDREIAAVMGEGLEPATASVSWSRLGRWHDTCAEDLLRLRAVARRSLLGHGNSEPLASVISRPAGQAPRRADVLASGLWVEPLDGGAGRFLPWGLVESVTRDSYRITLVARVVPNLEISGLGARTDEFLLAMAQAREEISGVDGWGIPLPGDVATPELQPLLTGADGARLLTWRSGEEIRRMVLVLRGGHLLAEPLEVEDHATFVFGTNDLDRVNAAILLGGFAREVLWQELEELGDRVALLRTEPEVRWLRETLTHRIIHDERWQDRIAGFC